MKSNASFFTSGKKKMEKNYIKYENIFIYFFVNIIARYDIFISFDYSYPCRGYDLLSANGRTTEREYNWNVSASLWSSFDRCVGEHNIPPFSPVNPTITYLLTLTSYRLFLR